MTETHSILAAAVVGLDPATEAAGAIRPGPEARRNGPKAARTANLAALRVIPGPISPRWAALIALLAAEVIGLTLRFETATATGLLPKLLLHSRVVFQLLVVVLSVSLLCHGTNRWEATARRDGSPARRHRRWPYVLAHFGALASFAWITAVVLEGGARPLLSAFGWGFAWAGLGLATLVSWIGIGLPPDRCLALLWRGPGRLLAGAAIGLATWGTGRIASDLWHPLGHSTLWAVSQMLRPFVAAPYYRPGDFTIGSPTFKVFIAPPARGTRGWG